MSTPYEDSLRDEAIARAVAGGASRGDICTAYDLTPAGLQSITGGEAFAGRVEHYRVRLQLASQLNVQFVTALVPQALSNLEAILRDPNHKDWSKVSMDVVKQGLPQRHEQSGDVGVHLKATDETVTGFIGLMRDLLAARASQPAAPSLDADPRLIDKQPTGLSVAVPVHTLE